MDMHNFPKYAIKISDVCSMSFTLGNSEQTGIGYTEIDGKIKHCEKYSYSRIMITGIDAGK